MPDLATAGQWTYQDLVEHVLDVFELQRSRARHYRMARGAVQDAMRDLSALHSWKYYQRHYVIVTEAPQNDGTIEYDHTGGANERMVTLTSATWPSWAEKGRIIIGDTPYQVEERISDTVITLPENANPGTDVASGTSYYLYQSDYVLPDSVFQIIQIRDGESQHNIRRASAKSTHIVESWFRTPAHPVNYTVQGSGDTYGKAVIKFSPMPDESREYTVLYWAAPRALKLEKYYSGTITTSGTTVTLTSGTFPEDIVGAVLRVSENGDPPTGRIGDTEGEDNHYLYQRQVDSRTSDTALEMDSALTSDVTDAGFTLSDPVDIETTVMLTALQRWAEWAFAVRIKADQSSIAYRDQQKVMAFRLAKEMDNDQVHSEGNAVLWNPYRRTNIT